MAMIRTTTAALIILISSPALVREMSAADLYGFCVSTDAIVQNVCSKYILGAVQGISLAAGKLGDKTTFCIPDEIGEGRAESEVTDRKTAGLVDHREVARECRPRPTLHESGKDQVRERLRHQRRLQ